MIRLCKQIKQAFAQWRLGFFLAWACLICYTEMPITWFSFKRVFLRSICMVHHVHQSNNVYWLRWIFLISLLWMVITRNKRVDGTRTSFIFYAKVRKCKKGIRRLSSGYESLSKWVPFYLHAIAKYYCFYCALYNKLSYARILIGSHLWSIGGQTYRWRHH